MIGKTTKKNSTRANQIALAEIIFDGPLTRITSTFISKNTNNPHNRDSKLSTISKSNLQAFYIYFRNFRSNDP